MTDWTAPATWTGTRRQLLRATGLHPGAYTDPAFFAVEQERVFSRAWVCIGLANEVAEIGRMLVRTVGPRSVLITLNADGQLRGFLNSCRHRGTELAESDCDVAHTIRCPYHRWGYDLDGALRSTPRFDEIPREDFSRSDHGLIPVRVDMWGPLLFACLSDDTAPLTTWLGDLPERMAGYGLDGWRTKHEQQVDIEANWKLVTENFQEYYHLTWVHPELAKVSRVADHYRYQGPGMYCGQSTTPVTSDDRDDWTTLPAAPGLDESDAASGRFVAIFPNVILSVLPNHAWMMRLDPIAPGSTREICTLLVPPTSVDLPDETIRPTRDFWIAVNSEDVGIVARSQRGLQNGAVPAGPLAPRFEEPLHRFHNMLADHMTIDDSTEIAAPPGDRTDEDRSRWGTGVNPLPAAIDDAPRLTE